MSRYDWAQKEAVSRIKAFEAAGYISRGWRFEWSRARRQLGVCVYPDKVIKLSYHYVQHAEPEQIIDTIIHELCHAKVGHAAGHGPIWQAACRQHGAIPKRCSKNIETMPSKYIGKCPVCDTIFKANRRLKHMNKRYCRHNGCSAMKLGKAVVWRVNTFKQENINVYG